MRWWIFINIILGIFTITSGAFAYMVFDDEDFIISSITIVIFSLVISYLTYKYNKKYKVPDKKPRERVAIQPAQFSTAPNIASHERKVATHSNQVLVEKQDDGLWIFGMYLPRRMVTCLNIVIVIVSLFVCAVMLYAAVAIILYSM